MTTDINTRILALKVRHDWTNVQVAAYLGIPESTVGNWCQGTRKPNRSVLRLLDVLGTLEIIAPEIHAGFMPERKGK